MLLSLYIHHPCFWSRAPHFSWKTGIVLGRLFGGTQLDRPIQAWTLTLTGGLGYARKGRLPSFPGLFGIHKLYKIAEDSGSLNYPLSFLFRYLERLVRSLVYLPIFSLRSRLLPCGWLLSESEELGVEVDVDLGDSERQCEYEHVDGVLHDQQHLRHDHTNTRRSLPTRQPRSWSHHSTHHSGKLPQEWTAGEILSMFCGRSRPQNATYLWELLWRKLTKTKNFRNVKTPIETLSPVLWSIL